MRAAHGHAHGCSAHKLHAKLTGNAYEKVAEREGRASGQRVSRQSRCQPSLFGCQTDKLGLLVSGLSSHLSSHLHLAKMRSPVFAISLVAAAVATASAQSHLPSDAALSPTVQGNVGLFHLKSPRQYPPKSSGRDNEYAKDIDRERGEVDRERADGLRNHPDTPHLSSAFPAAGGCFSVYPVKLLQTSLAVAQGASGGISKTNSAVGANAVEGGDSADSPNSGSASGANVSNKVAGVVSGMELRSFDFVPLPLITWTTGLSGPSHKDSYAFRPQDSAYIYRMKRVALGDFGAGQNIPDTNAIMADAKHIKNAADGNDSGSSESAPFLHL